MASAIYDLRCAPITYDFCNFLALASIYAELQQAPHFDVVVRADSFRNVTPREKSYSLADRLWRVKNLIAEVVTVAKPCRDYSVLRSPEMPESVSSLIPSYDVVKRTGIPYLLADVYRAVEATGKRPRIFGPSESAIFKVREIFPKKPFVTLSLRSAKFDGTRNVSLHDWWRAIERANIDLDRLLIIPDQDDMLGVQEILKYPWRVFQPAAFSLDLRLAALSAAACNLMSMGGMTAPLWYSDINFVIFNIFHENHYVADAQYFRKSANMSIGDQFLWALPNQKLDWIDANPDRLIEVYFSGHS
jgi:hypothetical protein